MRIKWKILIPNLIIPLAVGALSGFLTRNAMEKYLELRQPPLSPPPAVFPVVWTILFLLMGISAYLIAAGGSEDRDAGAMALIPRIYWIQLAVNFFWTLIFFNLGMFLFAFLWLILLIILVSVMIARFLRIYRKAGILRIPYLIWLIFAAYLNLAVFILN